MSSSVETPAYSAQARPLSKMQAISDDEVKDVQGRCSLRRINLSDPTIYAEFQQQRRRCGWKFEPRFIDAWREACSATPPRTTLYWITTPSGVHAGHIALETYSAADREAYITTLFVDQAYRGQNLANAAMDLAEAMAKSSVYGGIDDCRAVVVDTISKRYFNGDESDPDGQGLWKRLGYDKPKLHLSAQAWYERRGFVFFKTTRAYPISQLMDGTYQDGVEKLWASWLRKPVV